MDGADNSIVFFSHHALQLKGLPDLDKGVIKAHFDRKDLEVIDNKDALEARVRELIKTDGRPVFLLLMSSGTFDGIDWNSVSSQ